MICFLEWTIGHIINIRCTVAACVQLYTEIYCIVYSKKKSVTFYDLCKLEMDGKLFCGQAKIFLKDSQLPCIGKTYKTMYKEKVTNAVTMGEKKYSFM